MTIIIAWWCFGTFSFLVAFWTEGSITVLDLAGAVAFGFGWPIFLPTYFIARYGDRIIWRRK